MAVYNVPAVGEAWVTLPTPTAAAWIQPINGELLWTTRTVPDAGKAFRLKDDMPLAVKAGSVVKVRSALPGMKIVVVMEDQP